MELVFVVLLLFGLLFGAINFALIQASDNAGTNAAREGARQAILDYSCADLHASCPASSPSLQRVVDRVNSRLGGLTAGAPTVSVVCWDGTTAIGVQKNCDPAVISPTVDLVEVDVSWKRLATTPYGTVSTRTDKAIMTIQGSGQGTRSTACQITATVSPSVVAIDGVTSPGPLTTDVVLTAQTNGFCQPLAVSFTPDTAAQGPLAMCFNSACTATSGTTFVYTIPKSAYAWTPGTHNLNISENGYPLSPTHAPTLTVSAGSACTITSASVTPTIAVLATGTGARALAQPVNLAVTTASSTSCAGSGLRAVFNTNGGADQVVTLAGTAPSFSLAIPAAAYTWTTGSKLFSIIDSTGAAVATPASVVLEVADPCGLSVSLSPSSVTVASPVAVNITATPSTGSVCTGLTITYRYGPRTNAVATTTMTAAGGTYAATIPASTPWVSGTWSMSFTIGGLGTPTSPSIVAVIAS
ncbi:MAG: hypothetical protein NVSMB16_00740 [Acidimicrobiales bacterium]